ncbi:hypothetical protein OG589_13400 [Sphaerisporangium sp. NBC_01403]|uniref:hypothetical protein n=1 Tax=Sphaerisporangium sp. NBC_01403 TaxID=2903599 RepID=UPI0032564EFF
MIILAIVAGAVAVNGIWPDFRAYRGEALPGVFEPQYTACPNGRHLTVCHWYGEFRSDDGSTQRSDVWIDGIDPHDQPLLGRIHAIDAGADEKVYVPRPGSESLLSWGALLLVAIVCLVAGLTQMVDRPFGWNWRREWIGGPLENNRQPTAQPRKKRRRARRRR